MKGSTFGAIGFLVMIIAVINGVSSKSNEAPVENKAPALTIDQILDNSDILCSDPIILDKNAPALNNKESLSGFFIQIRKGKAKAFLYAKEYQKGDTIEGNLISKGKVRKQYVRGNEVYSFGNGDKQVNFRLLDDGNVFSNYNHLNDDRCTVSQQ